MNTKKRILVLDTGGTMGMESTDKGFRPRPGYLKDQMDSMPELSDESMPDFVVREYQPVLDSSNFTPDDWQRIADDIADSYLDFDAFVVIHGTDTMAYTASALAFMLQGLSKNVILTGSQLPLCRRRNDARENLVTAMILASEYDIPEVCVCFGSRLLRGCRSTKISTTSFEAFDSPNDALIGSVGTNIHVFESRINKSVRNASLSLKSIRSANIATFQLFPGVQAEVLQNVLQTPLDGLILETFGSGNGPSENEPFMNVLQTACDRGVVIVNLSQCVHGGVSQDDYETGRALSDVGVVSGKDMTMEAATAKLMYLFSQGLDCDEIRDLITQNLVGELTA